MTTSFTEPTSNPNDRKIANYDLYAGEAGCPVEDLKLVRVENDWNEGERMVWFTWRDRAQWIKMSNREDDYWLIVDSVFTDEFAELVNSDDFLENYDSLESTFDLNDLFPTFEAVTFGG